MLQTFFKKLKNYDIFAVKISKMIKDNRNLN